jgi:malonyl-CoA O-methyltransferase
LNSDSLYQRRAFDRAAARYEERDFFHREIRGRMYERLQLFRIEPKVVLDLGAGTGSGSAELSTNYPEAKVVGLDSSFAMANLAATTNSTCVDFASVCADAIQLPFADNSIDVICSNLTLQYCSDLDRVVAEIHRVLRPEGLFLFTTLGAGSLQELRRAWSGIDRYSHVDPFVDLHDIGDKMMTTGFSGPVMDSEVLTITYSSVEQLLTELRAVATTREVATSNPGLISRHRWEQMSANYEELRNADGVLPVTLEVVYGHAWGGQPPHGVVSSEGEAHFPLEQLRKLSRQQQ